ncbi:hypothetical protein BH23ACT6_BH23ACT6_18830 [soil metagenome]
MGVSTADHLARSGWSGWGLDGLAEYTQAKSIWCETAADAPLPFGY